MRPPFALSKGRTIAIWGVPRSVSTAFEKTFTRLDDLRIVHEPFSDCYYFGPYRRSDRYGSVDRAEVFDPRSVLGDIERGRNERILFKDLCFQACHYVPDDVLDRFANTFIIRHPDLVIDSLRRLKPDFTEEELGFDALAEMFDRVLYLGQQPVVVEGQIFRKCPEEVLRRYCAMVDLSFHPGMLCWKDGRIRSWAPHEVESQAKWHATLEASARIEPPLSDAPSSPIELGELYERAVAVYEKVAKHAITPTGEMVTP
jgi:Sulfotransferase domain